MNRNLKVSKSVVINSTKEKVWEVLTLPDKIKIYLFGTETITDWKPGSPIIFQGEYEGHKYKDKGNVLENKPNELLKYSYWSGFSGLEDKDENYSIITYTLEGTHENQIKFTWAQEGFATKEGHQHSETSLGGMLEQIKNLVEEL